MNVRPYRNLYVHVPFCNGKCAYCSFYSEPAIHPELVSRWLDRLEQDAAHFAPETMPLDTIYLGGGTPTALSPDALRRLFAILESNFRCSPDLEFSTECNPESLTPEKAEILASRVNRVSMGVQSFDPVFRERIGRRGEAESVVRALRLLRNAGIRNIGFDLIYALPGQTLEDWEKDLRTALTQEPEHLSAYSLILEEGTPLAARGIPPEDDELSYQMWEKAQEILSSFGMPRYEISNYASRQYECRHNQNVWHGQTYLGLGPSACSFDGRERRTEAAPLEQWLSGAAAERDVIEDSKRLAEIFIMGLRTVRGWKKNEFEEISGLSWNDLWCKVIRDQTGNGMLAVRADEIAPTEQGLAFWNPLAEEFL